MRKSRKQQKNDRRRVIPITAKTPNQKEYIRDIVDNDVVFCTGPSGSGKSYIAAGIAANHIYKDEVEEIIYETFKKGKAQKCASVRARIESTKGQSAGSDSANFLMGMLNAYMEDEACY